MKKIAAILVLLGLLAGCATTEAQKTDPKVSTGGSIRVRGSSSSGI